MAKIDRVRYWCSNPGNTENFNTDFSSQTRFPPLNVWRTSILLHSFRTIWPFALLRLVISNDNRWGSIVIEFLIL